MDSMSISPVKSQSTTTKMKSQPFCASKLDPISIPLEDEWFEQNCLPEVKSLEPPNDFVSVFTTDCTKFDLTLEEWGVAARSIIDANIKQSGGAILLRGLTNINTAAKFSVFWNACYKSGDKPWTPTIYDSFPRPKEDGVDVVPHAFPDHKLLTCHNELVYLPNPMRKIMLFCVQDAEQGGESLVASNKKLTQIIHPDLLEFTRKHKGLVYSAKFMNGKTTSPVSSSSSKGSSTPPAFSNTWHHRCGIDPQDDGVDDMAEARKYFIRRGYKDEWISFDSQRNINLIYPHSGM